MIEVTESPLSLEAIINEVRREDYGAVVSFMGTVRALSQGKKVLSLEYEAYKEMVEKKLQEIIGEISKKWQLQDIAICHRIGKLKVGEIAVVIAVAAPHRRGAFDACQYAINRLKEIAPIWKREIYEDGKCWVENPEAHFLRSKI